jgi:hypothetical protein
MRRNRCDKCGQLWVEKDNQLLGPLVGRYEYLLRNCALIEGLVYPLRWKPGQDPR